MLRSGYPLLVRTLLGLCEGYLAQPGGVRDMAGACMGRLLVRPDCVHALADFVAWARDVGLRAKGPEAAFLVPGTAPACTSGAAPVTPKKRCIKIIASRRPCSHRKWSSSYAGITRTLALIFDTGQRAQLLPQAAELWPLASELASSEAAAASVLSR